MTDTTDSGQTTPPPASDPWAPPSAAASAAAGHADPWAPPSAVVEAEAAAAPRRKARLPWILAAGILAVTAVATATAVMIPQRTDIPGLATPNDGRYAFPQLTLPPLPAGQTDPSGSKGRHYADLRKLVLPAPKGVTVPAADWAACGDFAQLYQDGAKATAALTENACRAAVHRTWTASDGTRTDIWLLQFGSREEADGFYGVPDAGEVKGAEGLQAAPSSKIDGVPYSDSVLRATYDTAGPGPDPVGRMAEVGNGDVVFTVLMTNPNGVPAQAFRQVTLLQYQLLG